MAYARWPISTPPFTCGSWATRSAKCWRATFKAREVLSPPAAAGRAAAAALPACGRRDEGRASVGRLGRLRGRPGLRRVEWPADGGRTWRLSASRAELKGSRTLRGLRDWIVARQNASQLRREALAVEAQARAREIMGP